MKKLFAMAFAVGMLCNAQAADLYKASKNVALRAPAVPLITSDPYLSIWSPTDALNESSTMHWTGTEHPCWVPYVWMGKPIVLWAKIS